MDFFFHSYSFLSMQTITKKQIFQNSMRSSIPESKYYCFLSSFWLSQLCHFPPQIFLKNVNTQVNSNDKCINQRRILKLSHRGGSWMQKNLPISSWQSLWMILCSGRSKEPSQDARLSPFPTILSAIWKWKQKTLWTFWSPYVVTQLLNSVSYINKITLKQNQHITILVLHIFCRDVW